MRKIKKNIHKKTYMQKNIYIEKMHTRKRYNNKKYAYI